MPLLPTIIMDCRVKPGNDHVGYRRLPSWNGSARRPRA
jgi:hypothetical protein